MLPPRRETDVAPFALARQVREADERAKRRAERAAKDFKVLRSPRWYHTAAAFGLLVVPVVQYFGFFATWDARWFFYPLAINVALWTLLNTAFPVRMHRRLPLSWGKAGFLVGTGLLLWMLFREASSGLVVAYRAIAFDMLVFTSAALTVQLITFARYARSR